MNTTIEFCIFKSSISLCTTFQLKLAMLMFWNKFADTEGFPSKAEKVNTTIEFCIFKLILVSNFSWNRQYWLFCPTLPQIVFPVQNRNTEQCHWILHIGISLGTKFALKLQKLSFWTKVAPVLAGVKLKRWTPPLNFAYINKYWC